MCQVVNHINQLKNNKWEVYIKQMNIFHFNKRIATKLLVLFVILSSNINLYAAIVSDNDGSAFVSKAEFEAMKQSFKDQIEVYNDSIDKKIDGAISSYLAGISLNKPVTAAIINNSWEEVSAINGVLTNTYKVPDINIQFMLGTTWSSNGDAPEQAETGVVGTAYWTAVSHLSTLKYVEDWSTDTNCYRNLLVCTGANPTDVGDMIWDGQAVRYREQWFLTRSIMQNQHWDWLDRFGDVDFSITMSNLSTIKEAGYVTNWDSVKTTAWPITYRWVYTAKPEPASGSGGTGDQLRSFAASDIHDNFRTVVTLEKDDNGNDRRYKHIVSYKGDTEWRVSNPKWTTLLNASPESTIKSSNVKNQATLEQSAVAFGAAHHIENHQSVMDEIPITQNITDDATFPSIGLFKTLRKAKDIYQDNEVGKIEVTSSLSIDKERPKLNQGFQLIGSKAADTVTWEPEFNYTHVHNGTSTYTDNTHEVDVYFSNGPFTDDTTTSNLIKVKVGTDTTLKDYVTTTDRKCKVEFEMPADGIVYVKWIPHNAGTYLNSDWIVTLDLTKCNTYTYIRE